MHVFSESIIVLNGGQKKIVSTHLLTVLTKRVMVYSSGELRPVPRLEKCWINKMESMTH